MILIITIDFDPITPNICTWLLHYKKHFTILSIEDDLRIVRIENESFIIKNHTRNYEIDLKNDTKVFYRQGDVFKPPTFSKD